MPKRVNSEVNVFSLSFVDVFANTLGALAFILILVIMMIGLRFNRPFINTERLPEGYQNVPYEVWLSAREGGGVYCWTITSGALPEGLELVDGKTGLIKGVPALKDPRNPSEEYKLTLGVSNCNDSTGNAESREYSISIKNSFYSALTITTPNKLPKAIKGSPFPISFSALGGRPPYSWRKVSGNLPGLNLSGGGLLEGAVNSNPGSYSFTVSVSDQFGNRQQKDFQVEVVDIPDFTEETLAINTKELPAVIEGSPYDLALSARGGDGRYSWALEGELPRGISFTPEGYLSGTPSGRGSFSINFSVKSNDGKRNASGSGYILKVLPAPKEIEPLAIVSEEILPSARQGASYSLALSATGGLPPYHWEMDDPGNLGEEAKLNQNGVFSITPDTFGILQFTATTQDQEGGKIKKTFQLEVNPEIPDLEIVSEILPNPVRTFPYSLQLSALGGFPPYKWSLSPVSKLPNGLKLGENGKLKGNPTEAYRGEIDVTVSDLLGKSAQKKFPLEILESGDRIIPELAILTDTIPVMLTGEREDFYFAYEGGAFPLNWELDGDLPKGLEFDNGRIFGSPKARHSSNIRVRLRDPAGQQVEKEVQIISKRMVMSKWKLFALISGVIALLALAGLVIIWRQVKKARSKDLEILTKSIPNARSSFEYRVYLSASGGTPPYTWSLVEGQLPEGLELKPEGIIEGIPFKGIKVDEVKDIPFTLMVKDSLGNSVNQLL